MRVFVHGYCVWCVCTVCVCLCLCARYVPSQADVAIYNALKGAPPGKFVHALRWYNHIASYSEDEKLV